MLFLVLFNLKDLTRDEVAASLPSLNALAGVNAAFSSGNADAIWAALCEPELGVERLEEENKTRTCVRPTLRIVYLKSFRIFFCFD